MKPSIDSLGVRKEFFHYGKRHVYYSLPDACSIIGGDIAKLPFCIRVLLENLLRYEDGEEVKVSDISSLCLWDGAKNVSGKEFLFYPSRVLMQDFTGIPALVDLVSLRQAVADYGLSADIVNPKIGVDLVIDHSVSVDSYASALSYRVNASQEFLRNKERYSFLRWGQNVFKNLRVVPPANGICHQVNIEYLAKTVSVMPYGDGYIVFPDTVIGTDSHTTMVNSLSVLGWGVGGIEAEAVMLGEGLCLSFPEVIGVRLSGVLPDMTYATDLVLRVTEVLREYGVTGKFVEFMGEGLSYLSLADRATISNMAPEYGANCGFFPIDEETCRYLSSSGRSQEEVDRVSVYSGLQHLWNDGTEPLYSDVIEIDLSEIEVSLAGPKRPQDRISLSSVSSLYEDSPKISALGKRDLRDGDVVIAAITSCTNTSNPYTMLAAGLLASKAVKLGLKRKQWVKTSLAPGSKVVSAYLSDSGLLSALETLGFYIVGYGCTTCIGNSGPLDKEIEKAIKDNDLRCVSVLSGNRNFEGRIHSLVKDNYLASPALVVAYALCGEMGRDLVTEPLDIESNVYLADIWPSREEVMELSDRFVKRSLFSDKYEDIFKGNKEWEGIEYSSSSVYEWDEASSYIRCPPFFSIPSVSLEEIKGAKILALLGDSITTDHISPAGVIDRDSDAGIYLRGLGVLPEDLSSYGARRGNHEVMIRGTLANRRLQNEMVSPMRGGYTRVYRDNKENNGEMLTIFSACQYYKRRDIPLVIFAGRDYGAGSSRDWAAKGVSLLGVRAVIAESFERIHRSNLIGMGVLPLQFIPPDNRLSLSLRGDETCDIKEIARDLKKGLLKARITYKGGDIKVITLRCRIDTEQEFNYYSKGGILPYVLSNMCK